MVIALQCKELGALYKPGENIAHLSKELPYFLLTTAAPTVPVKPDIAQRVQTIRISGKVTNRGSIKIKQIKMVLIYLTYKSLYEISK